MSTQSKQKSDNLRKLVENAILVAVASVLCIFLKFDTFWGNGGSITICSALPIIIVSYRHGIKWGLLAGMAFALIQIISDPGFPPANEFFKFMLCIFLDYMAAFMGLGFGGVFRKIIKEPAPALIAGSALVLTIRFIAHFLSGVIVWGTLFDLGSWEFSFSYNSGYMIPEIIITCVGAGIVGTVLKRELIKGSSLDNRQA
jgi:thiamine transporter